MRKDGNNDLQILAQCDNEIASNPQNARAAKNRIIALIKLDKWDVALDSLSLDKSFERAYCLYRLNRLDDALNALCDSNHSLHLRAQILYRMDNFTGAAKVYAEIITDTSKDDPYYYELLANCNAAVAGAIASGTQYEKDILAVECESYEIAYNLATVCIYKSKFDEAEILLLQAIVQCENELQTEEYSAHDIQKETAALNCQLALVYQHQGKSKLAQDLLSEILKSTSADQVVKAIATNNLISISPLQKTYEHAAKYTALLGSKALYSRLNKNQKYQLALNSSILAMQMRKFRASYNAASRLNEIYPDSCKAMLVLAANSFKTKKPKVAYEELKAFFSLFPKSIELCLALCQYHISHLDYKSAQTILQECLDKNEPHVAYASNILSLIVCLHQQNCSSLAKQSLEKASDFWKLRENYNLTNIKTIARHKLSLGLFRDAALDFEMLVQLDKEDVRLIADLVLAYSEFDIGKAEIYAAYLVDRSSDVGGDGIEDAGSLLDAEYLGSGAEIFAGFKPATRSATEDIPKKHRKRKPRIPKNADLSIKPDPERWLPKQERSSFNQKNGRKDLNRGPQGVNISGGGIGTTGSARIGSLQAAEAIAKPIAPLPIPTKRKKGKR